MNTVSFDNYNSHTDLYSVLNSKNIGPATPKTEAVSIAGRDGVLDLTEYFGEVKYNNRKLTFEFTIMAASDVIDKYSEIQDKIHGRYMKITLSDDADYYYMGRVTVDSVNISKGICTYTVSVDAEPYKYKQSETTVTKTIAGSGTVTLSNLRKRAVPKITTSAAIQITFNGNTYAVSSGGTIIVAGIILAEGNNVLTITGNATVTFKYQEGRL